MELWDWRSMKIEEWRGFFSISVFAETLKKPILGSYKGAKKVSKINMLKAGASE